jgi:hypothetical protein
MIGEEEEERRVYMGWRIGLRCWRVGLTYGAVVAAV